jgi:hypothetical protein
VATVLRQLPHYSFLASNGSSQTLRTEIVVSYPERSATVFSLTMNMSSPTGFFGASICMAVASGLQPKPRCVMER